LNFIARAWTAATLGFVARTLIAPALWWRCARRTPVFFVGSLALFAALFVTLCLQQPLNFFT
jgi:hypothetical protein